MVYTDRSANWGSKLYNLNQQKDICFELKRQILCGKLSKETQKIADLAEQLQVLLPEIDSLNSDITNSIFQVESDLAEIEVALARLKGAAVGNITNSENQPDDDSNISEAEARTVQLKAQKDEMQNTLEQVDKLDLTVKSLESWLKGLSTN